MRAKGLGFLPTVLTEMDWQTSGKLHGFIRRFKTACWHTIGMERLP